MSAALTLTCCGTAPPLDCELVKQRLSQCIDGKVYSRTRELLLSCIPYSEAAHIEGTWITGFEANHFYEAPGVARPDETPREWSGTELDIDGTPLVMERGGPTRSAVVQVGFEGRRPLCDVPHPHVPRVILVDRVISMKVIKREVFY